MGKPVGQSGAELIWTGSSTLPRLHQEPQRAERKFGPSCYTDQHSSAYARWHATEQPRRVTERLIAEGQQHLQAPARLPVRFLDEIDPEALRSNELLSDLQRYPHAFVLACLADRQYPARLVSRIPERVRGVWGSFDMNDLARKTEEDWRGVLGGSGGRGAIHRLWPQIAKTYFLAVENIHGNYGGDASANLAGHSFGRHRGTAIPRIRRRWTKDGVYGREHLGS